MRTALEVLQEQRGAPQYSPKEYRALEASLSDASRQMHRLQAPVNAYLEAAAYRCEMAGALELIVTLDNFDFMRVKRRLRARYCSSLTPSPNPSPTSQSHLTLTLTLTLPLPLTLTLPLPPPVPPPSTRSSRCAG